MFANAADCWAESVKVDMALIGSAWHAAKTSMNDIGVDLHNLGALCVHNHRWRTDEM